MKRAVLAGGWDADLVDAPIPKPKADWVLIKVHAAPMCTEYKAFVTGKKMDYLGHEAVGEVVEVAQPGRVKEGDRVVAMPSHGCGKCNLCISGDYIHCENKLDFEKIHGTLEGSATMAQYHLKPDWLLMPIPEGVTYERASLACCALGPSFGALQAMGPNVFDTVMITGAGPIGLAAIVNARFRGARVISVESEPWRVDRAREMGAADVLDPADKDVVRKVREMTAGRGVDYALDCSGSIQAQRLCIDAVRRKGRIAFIGECDEDLCIRVSGDLIRKGVNVMGAWHYNLNHFWRVMKVVQESPIIDKLISHVFPMSHIQEAFEASASHETAKVILKPWE
jgi:threonine dehydrogenase-like Zn-dependent dehydrogenase